MEPLISVIVPIYKVEKYLKRAIDSIREQTYTNLEILLVEDGSPDLCGQICDQYAKEDSRIRVIHKPNGGLSDARNAGLDQMTGEYVVFVDSDDYIADFFIEELYQILIRNDADVSFCRYEVVTKEDRCEADRLRRFYPAGSGRETVAANVVEKTAKGTEKTAQSVSGQLMEICDRHRLLLNMYDRNHPDATYFIVSWNKLYKAALWEGIRFPKGKIHEDEATTYKIFDKTGKGVYVKVPMYAYFSAPSSITRDAFSLKRLDWMDALTDRIRYFEKKGERDLVSCGIQARADGAIKYYYPLIKTLPEEKEAQKKLKEYVREALSADRSYHNLTSRNRIGYRLFLLAPWLYRKLL